MEKSKVRSLKITDIIGYIPYGLQVVDSNNNLHIVNGVIGDKLVFDDNSISEDISLLYPILYPINYLSKTIIYKGKEIIPILELAKMSSVTYNTDWEIEKGNIDKLTCAFSKTSRMKFYYGSYHKCFYSTSDNEWVVVNNQSKMFDYLHELKFDFKDLIHDGLAIDVNEFLITKKHYEKEI